MQNLVEVHLSIMIESLHSRCTLPNLANIRLHDTSFVRFAESDKYLLQKKREDMATMSVVSANQKDSSGRNTFAWFNNWVYIFDANKTSQVQSCCICHTTPTGLYARWELDCLSCEIQSRQNTTRLFENLLTSYFQEDRQKSRVERLSTQESYKNNLMATG